MVIVDDELKASLSPALQDYNNGMQKLPTINIERILGTVSSNKTKCPMH